MNRKTFFVVGACVAVLVAVFAFILANLAGLSTVHVTRLQTEPPLYFNMTEKVLHQLPGRAQQMMQTAFEKGTAEAQFKADDFRALSTVLANESRRQVGLEEHAFRYQNAFYRYTLYAGGEL
jgi:hypothetical protein